MIGLGRLRGKSLTVKASESCPPGPVQSQLPGLVARSRLKVGAHNMSYVNW